MADSDSPTFGRKPEGALDAGTYRIVRFYQRKGRGREGGRRTIDGGLTRAEAQAHCSKPETRGRGWFDGFERE